MPEYSFEHICAFNIWRAKGFDYGEMSPQQILALREDPNIDGDFRKRERHEKERQKEAAERAAERAARQPAAPVARNVWQELTKFEGGDINKLYEWMEKNGNGATPLAFFRDLSQAALKLKKRIVDLESKVAALEGRRSLKYCGVYQQGQAYADQEACTFSGSLWIATRDTAGTPGVGDSGWQLAAKRGADGKGAR